MFDNNRAIKIMLVALKLICICEQRKEIFYQFMFESYKMLVALNLSVLHVLVFVNMYVCYCTATVYSNSQKRTIVPI